MNTKVNIVTKGKLAFMFNRDFLKIDVQRI